MVPPIELILAIGKNREVGYKGGLPWKCPEDMAHFAATTLDHAVIMGANTFRSLPKPLTGRQNIVVSSGLPADTPGVQVARTLDEALAMVEQGKTAFVIGGVHLWGQALRRAQRVILSLIPNPGPADVFISEGFMDCLNDWFEVEAWEDRETFQLVRLVTVESASFYGQSVH